MRTGPDNGPIFEGAYLVSNETAVVTWIDVDLENKTHLDYVNDYDFTEFEVTLNPLPIDPSLTSPSAVVVPKGQHNFTFTEDHFSVFRIGVAIKNSHGTGPERSICVALGEDGMYAMDLFVLAFFSLVLILLLRFS